MKFFFNLLSILLFFSIFSCDTGIQNELESADSKEEIAELREAAKSNFSDPEKAKYYALEMLRLAEEANDEQEIGNAHNLLGAISRIQEKYVEALQSYIRSAEAFEYIDDTIGMGKIYNNIGNLYRDIHKFDKAIAYYQKSLTAKTLLKDKAGMAISNRNKAYVYQLKGDYEKAKDSYWTALYLWKTLEDDERMAQLYNDLGIVYDIIADSMPVANYAVEKNIVYNLHLNSLLLNEKINNEKGIGWVYNNLATSLIKKQEFEKALGYLNQSLSIKKATEDVDGLAKTYNNLGFIYLSHYKESETALSYFKAGEKLASGEELKKSLLYITSILEKQGNFPEAIAYFKKLDMIKEELQLNEYKEELARVEARYSIEYAGL